MKFRIICLFSLVAVNVYACCFMSCDPSISKAYQKLDNFLNTNYSTIEQQLNLYQKNVQTEALTTQKEIKSLNRTLKRAELYLLKQKHITFELQKLNKLSILKLIKTSKGKK